MEHYEIKKELTRLINKIDDENMLEFLDVIVTQTYLDYLRLLCQSMANKDASKPVQNN